MIVLDTHALIFWLDRPDLLSTVARRSIRRAHELGVSVISCWEIGMLVRKGRLDLDRPVSEWMAGALRAERLFLLPMTSSIAVNAAMFDDAMPGDPADRLIVATALHHDAPLATKDQRIRRRRGKDDLVRFSARSPAATGASARGSIPRRCGGEASETLMRDHGLGGAPPL